MFSDNRALRFLQSILMANKFKYTYGRKVTEEKYMNDLIDLPIQHNADGTPFIDVNKNTQMMDMFRIGNLWKTI